MNKKNGNGPEPSKHNTSINREDTLKLRKNLAHCLLRDKFWLKRKMDIVEQRIKKQQPVEKILSDIIQKMESSMQIALERKKPLKISYPAELPVSGKKEQIKAALSDHPVVIVAGETGSGKTTQIPKMLLELGYGVAGRIGHTQPRRLAARSVAERLAEELGESLGNTVGYKVRFNDQIKPESRVKLMTDGIILNEIHHDKLLNEYDAIIVDEAHERSLNIDFLLGYLKRLSKKRRDLKIVITSATIDPERFAKHFDCAPIIEVSGRTYPVEVLYHPYQENDEDEHDINQTEAIINAVDELGHYNAGDTLVFLSSEREIRETEKKLSAANPQLDVLPLFGRLSQQEQFKIFHPGAKRRVILATNVAETSITVPRIKNVIDTGLARISRYSHRAKIQRLPIEPISQASANQRKGRCGRLAEGVCIRLYSEDHFNERPEFTDAEILRTNLASVILQMSFLELGDLNDFPFIDPPPQKYIADGRRLLEELGAIDAKGRLSTIGKQLAKLPIEPRLGRMIIEGHKRNVLHETLIVASALSIQDPRERPLEFQQKADEMQAQFKDKQSDFAAYLNLWNFLKEQQDELSNNQFRQLCKKHFIAYMRVREWRDMYRQLKELTDTLKFKLNTQEADYQTLHQCILSGLLSHIAVWSQDGDYKGARNLRFNIFPGSGQFKKKHTWIVAFELVETGKLYGRTVAKIEPNWLIELSPHLVKKSYLEPHWERKRGYVVAFEQQSLFGLIISSRKKVNFGSVEPEIAREIFIREGLVHQQIGRKPAFVIHNQALLESLTDIENKTRRRDIVIDEEGLFQLYDKQLPHDIHCVADLQRVLKKNKQFDEHMRFTKSDIQTAMIDDNVEHQFPSEWTHEHFILPLSYRFEPGHPEDGVTLTVPVSLLNQLDPLMFERLVPGLLEQKVEAMLRALPKSIRKNFVPVPDYAKKCYQALCREKGAMHDVMTQLLYRETMVKVPQEAWQSIQLEPLFYMNFRVIDNNEKLIEQGRDLQHLMESLSEQAKDAVSGLGRSLSLQRDKLTDWNFDDLKPVKHDVGDHFVLAYPTLIVKDYLSKHSEISLTLTHDEYMSEQMNQRGIRALIIANCDKTVRYLERNIPRLNDMAMLGADIVTKQSLTKQLIDAGVARILIDRKVETKSDYEKALVAVEQELVSAVNEISEFMHSVLTTLKSVQKQLRQCKNLQLAKSVHDIQAQIKSLFFDGFIATVPADALGNYPRYMKGIDARIERMDLNPGKEQQNLKDIEPWQEILQQFEQQQPDRLVWPESWQSLRWMIEEYRISLFAQGVKTAFPVSSKRLDKQLAVVNAQS